MGRIGLHGADVGCPPLFSAAAASGDANPGELPPPASAGLHTVSPAYRPALLTGLADYQPARGGERDGAVLIRLRAAPLRGFSGEQLRRLLLADAPGSPP